MCDQYDKMAELVWTEEREDELVVMWQNTPCLYDITDKSYSDRNVRQKALREISFAMNTSGKYLIIALHAWPSGTAAVKCGYRVSECAYFFFYKLSNKNMCPKVIVYQLCDDLAQHVF